MAYMHRRRRAMKYMLLIYVDEQALSGSERQACYAESAQLAHEIKASGQYLAANPLHPTTMATTVRVRDGKRFVTDGPLRRRASNSAAISSLMPSISTRRSVLLRAFPWRVRGPSRSGR